VKRLAVLLLVCPILQDPKETGTSLKGTPFTVVDAKVTPLAIDGRNVVVPIALDGNALLVVESGVLRRVAVPALKEDRQLPLTGTPWGMAMSKAGLAVGIGQELVLIDPATLAVRKRIEAKGMTKLAASPASMVLFATDGSDELRAVDGDKGAMKSFSARAIMKDANTARVKKNATGAPLGFWQAISLAPDGRTLFVMSFGTPHRFSVTGTDLKYEEIGPKLDGVLDVSDPTYIAVCCARPAKDTGITLQQGTLIYHGDFQKPVLVLHAAPSSYGRCAAFDPTRGLILVGGGTGLVTYDATGLRGKEYPFGEQEDVVQVLLTPAGAVVRTQKRILWMELPR